MPITRDVKKETRDDGDKWGPRDKLPARDDLGESIKLRAVYDVRRTSTAYTLHTTTRQPVY